MRTIPLAAVPSQTLSVILDGQAAQIALRQNGASMYLDLTVDDEVVVLSRICRDRQFLLLDVQYRGFQGELMFLDLQGNANPFYTGLGARYVLVFLSADELPARIP